jgi:hypothetical protein
MTGPSWLHACLAVVMLAVAACCAARLFAGRLRGWRSEPEGDVLHVLMGVAMAGMLESRLSTAPAVVWLAVFGSAALWFAWRAIRTAARPPSGGWRLAHSAPHAVECIAMVCMLWPARLAGRGHGVTMAGMSAAGPAPNPALALVLSLFMLGYILWTTDQFAAARRGAAQAGQPVRASTSAGAAAGSAGADADDTATIPTRVGALTKITMSAAMAYMLLAMA